MTGTDEKRIKRKLEHSLAGLKRNAPDAEVSNEPTLFVCVFNSGGVCGVSIDEFMSYINEFDADAVVYAWTKAIPFTIVQFSSVDRATTAHMKMHGTKSLMTSAANVTFYCCYLQKVPQSMSTMSQNTGAQPSGLEIISEFIDSTKEDEIVHWVDSELLRAEMGQQNNTNNLKHRRVLHYGRIFRYGSNDVSDVADCAPEMPAICVQLIDMFMLSTFGRTMKRPDQCTINVYEPGDGIASHVDSHSPFEDAIVSISLLSDVQMEFRPLLPTISSSPMFICINKFNRYVHLPARSCAIMSGECRYAWKHGIASRKHDVLPNGRVITRKRRVSLTFRTIRNAPCICPYPAVCDHERGNEQTISSKTSSCDAVVLPRTDSDGRILEQNFVNDVYNEIADHFDCTRHSRWRGVDEFLATLDTHSLVLDVGCGNGKYLTTDMQTHQKHLFGCDASISLCRISAAKAAGVVCAADCLHLPYRDNTFDACVCIAVVHHMSTISRRLACFRQLLRVIKPGGRCLVTAWAFDQRKPVKNDGEEIVDEEPSEYIKWGKAKSDGRSNQTINAPGSTSTLPIHINCTEFVQQDLLVPWKMQHKSTSKDSNGTTDKTLLRFYHVFRTGEMEELIMQLSDICYLERCYYEQGNWCAIIRKL